MSETLKHIQEINSHLGKLAKEAPGLSLEQLKKQYQHQQQKQSIKPVASDPGSYSLKIIYKIDYWYYNIVTYIITMCIIIFILILVPYHLLGVFLYDLCGKFGTKA